MTADLIELRNKNLVCVINPAKGGAITRLEIEKKGRVYPILGGPLFILAPIMGKIRNNAFKWEGKPYTSDLDYRDGPSRLGMWEGKRDNRSAATLRFKHTGNAYWPFSFSLHTVVDVDEDNITLTTELTNEERSGTMPAGLGARLTLPRPPRTHVMGGVSSLWAEDEGGIPTLPGEVTFNLDLKEGLTLDGLEASRWFSGWTGKAVIEYPETKHALSIKAEDGYGFIAINTTPRRANFELTLSTHIAGMLDIKGPDEDELGLLRLGPGESILRSFKIDVDLGVY